MIHNVEFFELSAAKKERKKKWEFGIVDKIWET
jgi:hypothetical protein